MTIDIPPKRTGCYTNGIYDKLRSLEIGESFKMPINVRKSIYQYAKDVGVKVATRTLGSKDEVTIYRTE